MTKMQVLSARNGLVKVWGTYDETNVVELQEGVLPVYEYSEIELENPDAFRVELYVQDSDGRIIDIQRTDGTSWAHPMGQRFKTTCTFRLRVQDPEEQP